MPDQVSQPSMAENMRSPHSHVIYIVSIVILAVLLIGAGSMAFWWTTQLNETQDRLGQTEAELAAERERAMTAEEEVAVVIEEPSMPFIYVENPSFVETKIYAVDRKTGEQTLLFEEDTGSENFAPSHYELYAVPQIGYEGIVYLTRSIEADLPITDLYSLDVETGAIAKLPWSEGLPFSFSAMALSPDETKIAAIYDNPTFDEVSKELRIWNLKDGTSRTLTTLEAGEYFSQFQGGKTFAGASGFELNWPSLGCVEADVFKDNVRAPEEDQKLFKDRRSFCE